METVALVPLRGGSKSIPRKNVKPLAGKPLCFWTIAAALDSECFSAVCVSTEDAGIKGTVADLFGGRVEIVDRPARLAADDTSTEAVMLHFAESRDFDALCTIQATSPLTRPEDFRAARDRFSAGGFDSLLTVCEFKRFLWDESGRALNYDPARRPRRQEFKGCLIENGAFYWTKRETLLSSRNRLGGRIGLHVMAPETAHEIDEPLDWLVVEQLLKARRSEDVS
ncbi:MAG: cytidylyltransferase domain-containing protein [Elusimicrobiota bacterium]